MHACKHIRSTCACTCTCMHAHVHGGAGGVHLLHVRTCTCACACACISSRTAAVVLSASSSSMRICKHAHVHVHVHASPRAPLPSRSPPAHRAQRRPSAWPSQRPRRRTCGMGHGARAPLCDHRHSGTSRPSRAKKPSLAPKHACKGKPRHAELRQLRPAKSSHVQPRPATSSHVQPRPATSRPRVGRSQRCPV